MDQREDRQRSKHPALLLERNDIQIPAVILAAGGVARFVFEEFFHGQIRNPYTRKTYLDRSKGYGQMNSLFFPYCPVRVQQNKAVRSHVTNPQQFAIDWIEIATLIN